MIIRKSLAGVAFALFTASSVPSFAAVFTSTADFSPSSNPAGGWSYGYKSSAGGSFGLYTSRGQFNGVDFWYLSGTGLPDIGHNSSGVPQGFTPANALEMSPGNTPALAGDETVLRWTAPTNDTYNIAASFKGIDTRGVNTLDSVKVNGSPVFTQAVISTGGIASFSSDLFLTVGSTVDFIVANNGSPGDRKLNSLDASIQTNRPVAKAGAFAALCR